MEKTKLGLFLPTDPRWVNLIEMNLEDILTDHAYCEQKATSSAISMIVNFPHLNRLVDEMTDLAAEEWSHFQMVLAMLKKRGLNLGKQRKDLYVSNLMSNERKGNKIERQLMDKLLINALIEARSCERFRLLSKELKDKELKLFYHQFMVSEAGHYHTFLDLAREYTNHEMVKIRWEELLIIESQIIDGLETRKDRMH